MDPSTVSVLIRLEPAGWPDSGPHPACPACAGELEVHQPDSDDPDRLLGTCPACGAWHLIDRLPAPDDRAVVVSLPGTAELRARLGL